MGNGKLPLYNLGKNNNVEHGHGSLQMGFRLMRRMLTCLIQSTRQ